MNNPTVVDQRIERDLRDQFDELMGSQRGVPSRRNDDVRPAVHRSTKSY